ncbi:VOC family protein [Nonomuraea aridisoli]|uniref:VOC family protein n=1 Tax=Nonomuraea aridisoli TaxID=2070368 RepID=UPI0015E87F20|nr:VOC family protein [Nonomuraea aridisoli]
METRTDKPSVWPCLSYRDARAAIRFLADAFGFVERACYTEGDAVAHAELAWPSGAGAIMLGSADESNDLDRPTGSALLYVVTDDPDALLARATAAGAEVVRDLKDEDYGNRTFTVRDPEGNLWSFGTYPGS